jgi:hypothetical protein
MAKALDHLDMKGLLPYKIKTVSDKPTVNIILNLENLKAIPIRSGTKQVYLLSLFLLNTRSFNQSNEAKERDTDI